MNLHGLVQAPRLWVTDPRADRRVTWMELFFDLIFVAAVAEVGSPLRADYSWPGLLLFLPLRFNLVGMERPHAVFNAIRSRRPGPAWLDPASVLYRCGYGSQCEGSAG